MTGPLTFGSVCSGIEAASVAWNPLGWRAAWLSEIEPFPSAVLAYHHPDVPNLGDMTTIAARVLAGEVPAPDVLCGGTPCQAFSVAGLRGGLSDARGQLTLSYVELANAIDTARSVRGEQPAIIVWENVPGVLSSKDNAFGCFLGALAGEDCELKPSGGKWSNAGCVFGPQRTIAWRVLDAQYFGVAQRRRRVFVVASARNGFNPTEVLFEFDGMRRDSAPSRNTGASVAALTANGVGTCGADDNQAQAGHLITGNGGGVAAYPLQEVGKRTGVSTTDTRAGLGIGDDGDMMFTLQASAQHGIAVSLRGRDGGATAELGGDVASCLRASTGGGDKPHVLALSIHENQRAELTLNDTAGAIKCAGGKPGQGYPAVLAFDSRQDPVSSEHLFGALGASSPQSQAVALGVTVHGTDPTVQKVASYSDTAQCLRARTPGNIDNSSTTVVQHAMSVRRLTPRECERLQGFPDGYTSIPTWNGWRKMDAGETPESCRAEGLEIKQNKKTGKWRVKDVDGPRYKALGNSWAVPVARWVGRRINDALAAAKP